MSAQVLVIDDVPDNRLLLQHFVSRLGLTVESAAGGQEGLAMAASQPYDVVLLDIEMPGMNGFETVSQLRQNHFSGPVVALTGHSLNGDRDRYLRAGFNEYLQKPVTRTALEQVLKRLLRSQ